MEQIDFQSFFLHRSPAPQQSNMTIFKEDVDNYINKIWNYSKYDLGWADAAGSLWQSLILEDFLTKFMRFETIFQMVLTYSLLPPLPLTHNPSHSDLYVSILHSKTDHFTSVDAMKHYYSLKNKPYIELHVKKCLQRYEGENSSYQP